MYLADIPHQIHKGVIKAHLLNQCQELVREEELDMGSAALSRAHGLRHFRQDISHIRQWIGAEAEEIENVLHRVLAVHVSSEILPTAQALFDFVYYGQFEVQSETTLDAMKRALRGFLPHKGAFIEHRDLRALQHT